MAKLQKLSENPQAVYMSRLLKLFESTRDAYENYLEECIDAPGRECVLSHYCQALISLVDAISHEYLLYYDEFSEIVSLRRRYHSMLSYSPFQRWHSRELRFADKHPLSVDCSSVKCDDDLPF